MNIWDNLPKPFFVLAPMDDVTDTVFRRIVGQCAAPDIYFTEFVNTDGLQSPGRPKLMPKLRFTEDERPIIAQLWGLNPENFYKSAKDIAAMGYDGVDINFGCPIKNVVQNGACAAFILPENRGRAVEIIQAAKEGAGSLPLSVKTRLGYSEIDLSWHELLLKQKLNALSIHGRTKAQLSKVPADWETIGEIRKLRDGISPATKVIGNGDVLTRQQGQELAQKYLVDGIMVGRGIFGDPFVFAPDSPWQNWSKQQKVNLYKQHVQLFAATWTNGERALHTLNRFCKVYINGFEGAKELREQLMQAPTANDLVTILTAA
ncbi:MAG TPA: tRNA-dihydrouridine synthase [Candidatus Limnocylindrales bacterium]|nr:tRNA-dihydrouridine synthase [Candidatus Limnocylindrales bacterium]